MDTFNALPSRESELTLDRSQALSAGCEWLRQRADDRRMPGRNSARSNTSLDERPPLPLARTAMVSPATPQSPWKRFGAVAGIAAMVGLAFVIDRPDESTFVAERADVETFVDAAELEPGSLYHLVDQIGAREMWNAGYTGTGVNVAVVDTGVAQVDGLDGEGKVVAVADFSAESIDPALRYVDTTGHGTHLAGIIAGSETSLPAAAAVDSPQEFKGVAPDAGIVSVKVSSTAGVTNQNDVVAGIDWVVDNADELDIRVLSITIDSGSDLPYQQDALTAALERAWQAGITVVTAAGNDGADSGRLDSPAIDPHFIAVGGVRALDDGFEIAEWSNSGDGVRNPDVTAPGAHVQSLRAPGSDADLNHREGFVDDETFLGSGTSQSAAAVAGAVALLLDAHPEWTNDQVKSALASTAVPLDDVSDTVQGNGMIRVDQANAATDLTQPNAWPTATVGAADEAVTPTQGFASIWSGAEWSGAEWSGAEWSGAEWSGAEWSGAEWSGAEWSGAEWSGAEWSGAEWSGAEWSGAEWSGAEWSGAEWSGAEWSGAEWSGAEWSGAEWSGAEWSGAEWSGAEWSGAEWSGAEWSGAEWSGAEWSGAEWSGAEWSGAEWSGAEWSGA